MATNLASLKPPFKVKARYGWSGQTKGDLGFLEGDIMEVTRIAGSWFYGRLLRNKKCSGYFPHNFVILLEERLNSNSLSENSRQSSKRAENLETSNKVVIPPVPSRFSFEESRTKKKLSSSVPNSPKRPADSLTKVRKARSKEIINEESIYNTQSSRHQNISAPNLPISNQTKPKVRNFEDSLKNPLPPLPPLPDLSNMRRTDRRTPKKSHSANDLNLARSSREYNYYKDNQKFYDGFIPEKRSSLGEDSISSGLFSNSQYLDDSVCSSENSFALMSDFSATSAGSFARHKYAQSFSDSLQRSQHAFTSTNKGDDQQQFSDSNSSSRNGKMGDILRKIIIPKRSTNNASSSISSPQSPKAYPKLPDIQNLNLSATPNEARDWIAVKCHLNRARTLTKYEKHPRYMRALEENRDLVLHPQDSIYNGLNTNEVKGNTKPGLVDVELAALNIEYIDKMTWKRCVKDGGMTLDSWAQTTFSARYSTVLEKLRGVYIFCTEMFALTDDNGSSDFSSEPENLGKTLFKKHCTPYELTWLFKKLANSLGIICEVVIGFLKTPSAVNWEFKYNHCWLRVLVNREWRFIDVILGNTTNPIHEFVNNRKIKKAENSYFLMAPLEMIYTHIPPREFEQHIVPSIDQLSALYLPLVFPSFFKNELKLYKFSTALSFLEDSEVYECSLEIPNDVEVFASVVIPTDNEEISNAYRNMELALTQIKKQKADSGRRVALIKAILPPGVSKGSLYVHSGVRGTQTSIANIHPLSMMIPLTHKGNDMKYEFLVKIPSESIQKVELYIVEPQSRHLFADNDYSFEIIQSPSDGIIYTSDEGPNQNRRQPMAVKSPSGRVHELVKSDPHFPYGTWKTSIKVKEPGVWSALVIADSGIGWSVFAEWLCV
ncbi:Cyk3p [Saccharomyces eubayanus]|uniref:Cyk3p n=1 Tax=Saccharomyces eubayanus TaxID=1080349 RepID=UPI0006C6704D|nr:CYK3-like protein [Saccharomyces eubayanus]KOH00252.1 CYK3-like protein [Saccharomyces eubayanus]